MLVTRTLQGKVSSLWNCHGIHVLRHVYLFMCTYSCVPLREDWAACVPGEEYALPRFQQVVDYVGNKTVLGPSHRGLS